jgi:hypothetical protein
VLLPWQIDITGPLFIFIFLISLGRNFTLRKWLTRIFSAVSNDGKCWLDSFSYFIRYKTLQEEMLAAILPGF